MDAAFCLSIIWKSDLSDEIKRNFFPVAVVSILLYGCSTCTLTKRLDKIARRGLLENATSYIEQILELTFHKTVAERPPTSHLKNHPNYTNKTCRTLLVK